MPRQDGTGPMGLGPKTGRRMGMCVQNSERSEGGSTTFGGRGGGRGSRRGFGQGQRCRGQFGRNFFSGRVDSDDYQSQINELEKKIQGLKDLLTKDE